MPLGREARSRLVDLLTLGPNLDETGTRKLTPSPTTATWLRRREFTATVWLKPLRMDDDC